MTGKDATAFQGVDVELLNQKQTEFIRWCRESKQGGEFLARYGIGIMFAGIDCSKPLDEIMVAMAPLMIHLYEGAKRAQAQCHQLLAMGKTTSEIDDILHAMDSVTGQTKQ